MTNPSEHEIMLKKEKRDFQTCRLYFLTVFSYTSNRAYHSIFLHLQPFLLIHGLDF